MAVNFLDLAKSVVGSKALPDIASSLGASEEVTKKAIDLAGSAILGGLIKKASTPQGASDLFNDVKKVDTSLLDGITDIFTGQAAESQRSSVSSMGWKFLSSLFGSKLDGVLQLLARLTGIGQDSSKSLLSMAAPLLLGTIAKEVKSGGLNLSDFTNLLMSQKSHVARNLPSSFTQELGIANLLDQGTQTAKRAAAETAEAGSNLAKILVPLAILLGVGLLIWQLTSRGAKEVAETTMEAAGSAVTATEQAIEDAADRVTLNKPEVPGFDLDAIKLDLGNSFGKLTESLSGITDEASATEVVPQIEEVVKQIGQYGFDKMPEESTSLLGDVIQPLVTKLQAALELAYKIPGVKPILEPVIGTLMDSVSAYAKTS